MISSRRRRIDENDPFFDEGNCGRPVNLICLPVAPMLDAEGGKDEEDVQGKLRAHVNRTHMYQCSECRSDFVTGRLLDMHISELHDSYFAVLSKKQPSYQCIVEGCSEVFWSNKERRKHLLSVHNFPWTYDFHEATKYMRLRKQKLKRDHLKAEKGKNSKIQEEMNEEDTAMGTEETKAPSGGEKTTPYEKEVEVVKTVKEAPSDSMDVEDLSSSFSKVRLVPNQISFGRRGRGRGRGRGRR